jgi:hypothetical protein
MATVTPNFNWPVPTSTDLVKDGATAIEALGDSIDASLVDLKGGTTGQVLSKTSNTDMDFTWVAADDTNAIQNTIVDAKGDLIAATAADTPARLAVGSDTQILIADSTQSTGLKWEGEWQNWSPSYLNLTVGNGSVIARYKKIGKTVEIFYRLTWGSTTTFTAYPLIGLPFNSKYGLIFTGSFNALDTGTGVVNGETFIENGRDFFQPVPMATNGTYLAPAYMTSNTVPFTWTTSDIMTFTFSYEAD